MTKILIIVFSVFLISGCCKRRAKQGITITVLDEVTYQPIIGVQVHIRDVQNHSSESLVDYGNTDSNGKVHLKLSEKCSDYLDIESGGNNEYYAGDYTGSTHTTKTLPKNITMYLQHK